MRGARMYAKWARAAACVTFGKASAFAACGDYRKERVDEKGVQLQAEKAPFFAAAIAAANVQAQAVSIPDGWVRQDTQLRGLKALALRAEGFRYAS